MKTLEKENGQAGLISDAKYKNEMLKFILNNSEAGVYVSDYYTGEVLFANQKTADFIGMNATPDGLVGQTCWEAINEGHESRCEFCAYKRLIGANGELLAPYTWERYYEKYGAWLKVTNQAIHWVDGRLAQITTFHDITELKRVQELVARHVREEENWKLRQNMETLLDKLPIAISITDAQTAELVYVNKALLEMFEYPGQERLLGRNVLTLLPPAFGGEAMRRRVTESLMREGVYNFEIEFITATGRKLETELITCVMDYKNRKSSVAIITDVALERENRRLLVAAAEREREANRLKSSFLSNMSHEIRTPMNAIIGLTEVELRKKPQNETAVIYKKINSSAKNLLQIINDILDLSKIEANKIELYPTRFELEEVLGSVLLVSAPRIEGKQVELILDMSPDLPRYFIGDRIRLWQILRNILDNAVKFTQKGNITLSVNEEEQSESDKVYISFSVSDTGRGMTQEQINKAFLPYEQIRGKDDAKYSGTGLGLPISKHLCQLMGGTISVQSKSGCGTVMKFVIPFTAAQHTRPSAETAQSLAGVRVLIVDDSELSVQVTEKLLSENGVTCVTAFSGTAAIKLISECAAPQFDIVLLDYIMDGMDGLECAKLMRRQLHETVKIVVLTAYESLLDKHGLSACGVDEVIEKPFVPTQLLKKLADILGKGRSSGDCKSEVLTRFKDACALVCEDVLINQEIIKSMLEEFGVKSIFAENGQKGIEILESGVAVDLIFMDLHMPVLDGYGAARIIRANHKYDALPIVSLTADAMVETFNECRAIGFNDVITKPTTFEDLHKTLLKWLPAPKRVYTTK